MYEAGREGTKEEEKKRPLNKSYGVIVSKRREGEGREGEGGKEKKKRKCFALEGSNVVCNLGARPN